MMNNYLRFSISGSNKFCQFSSFSFLKWSASRFSRETRIEVYQISPYFLLFINYVDSPLEVFSRETRIEVYQMSPYFLLFINYVDSPLEVFTISHSEWYPAFKPFSEKKGLFCLNFFIFNSRFSIKMTFVDRAREK